MEQRDEEDGSERRGAGGVRQGRRRGRGVAARGAPGRRARGSAEMGVCFRARAARSPGSVPLDLDRGGRGTERDVGAESWEEWGGSGLGFVGGGGGGICGERWAGRGRLADWAGQLASWASWLSWLGGGLSFILFSI